MADYGTIGVLARTQGVQDRILVGLDKQAIAIFAEDIATPNHDNRLVWATAVRDSGDYGPSATVIVRALLGQYPAAVSRFKENQGTVHVPDEDGLASDLDSVLSGFIDNFLAA